MSLSPKELIGKGIIYLSQEGLRIGNVIDVFNNKISIDSSTKARTRVYALHSGQRIVVLNNLRDLLRSQTQGLKDIIRLESPEGFFEGVLVYDLLKSYLGLELCSKEHVFTVEISNLITNTGLSITKSGELVENKVLSSLGSKSLQLVKSGVYGTKNPLFWNSLYSSLMDKINKDISALKITIDDTISMYLEDSGVYICLNCLDDSLIERVIWSLSAKRNFNPSIAISDEGACLRVRDIGSRYSFAYTLWNVLVSNHITKIICKGHSKDYDIFVMENNIATDYIDPQQLIKFIDPVFSNISLYPYLVVNQDSSIDLLLQKGTDTYSAKSVNDLINSLSISEKSIYNINPKGYSLYKGKVAEGVKSILRHFSKGELLYSSIDGAYIKLSDTACVLVDAKTFSVYSIKAVKTWDDTSFFYEIVLQRKRDISSVLEEPDVTNNGRILFTKKSMEDAINLLMSNQFFVSNLALKKQTYKDLPENFMNIKGVYLKDIIDEVNSITIEFFLYYNKGNSLLPYHFTFIKDRYTIIDSQLPAKWSDVTCAKFLKVLCNYFSLDLLSGNQDYRYCIYNYNEQQDTIDISDKKPIDQCKSLEDCKKIVRNRTGNSFLVVLFSKDSVSAMYKLSKTGNIERIA